jgi:Na+/H+-dicarboxylate symporter
MVPPNLFAAASENNVLGLIVFSLLFGGILTTLGEPGKRAVEFFDTVNNALLRFVQIVIWIAPIGVFGLVAARIGVEGGWDAVTLELGKLARYFVTVLVGLGIHGFVVLPIILWILARRNPLRYLINCSEALLTAFSTASSAATLPVTMRCTREKAGVGEEAAGFVLPVGATINMDGTALYEAVAVLFIAQAYGVGLGAGQQVIVLLTATLAAIGAAAIPQAGLFTMAIVLSAVGLPLEGIALLISIDWLLDRFRTAVNVWGDCIGTAAVDTRLGRNAAENPVNTG